MKTILLAVLLLAPGPAGYAQSRLLSLRTGVALTPDNKPADDWYDVREPKLAHWSQELGYGIQNRNGIRFDFVLQHFSDGAYAVSKPGIYDYGGTLAVRTNAVGLRFSLGYNLMRIFGKERRFRLTAGLALHPTLFWEHIAHHYSDMGGNYHEEEYSNRRFTYFGGLVLNPEYRLGNDWWLSGHLGFERRLAYPATINENYDGDVSPGINTRKMVDFSVGIARQL